MEITQSEARELLSVAGVSAVREVQVSRTLLVKALASVMSAPIDGAEGKQGVSWVAPENEFNSLLRDGNRLVHARVIGDRAEAASYGSPVDTLEAVDIEEVDAFGALDWIVRTWRVTLLDGTVITLHGGDYGHADKLAEFTRRHLLPH